MSFQITVPLESHVEKQADEGSKVDISVIVDKATGEIVLSDSRAPGWLALSKEDAEHLSAHLLRAIEASGTAPEPGKLRLFVSSAKIFYGAVSY